MKRQLSLEAITKPKLRGYFSHIIFLSFALFIVSSVLLVGCSSQNNEAALKTSNVQESIDIVKADFMNKSVKDVKAKYPGAADTGKLLKIPATFSVITGWYELPYRDDGDIWTVIFRWDKEEKFSKNDVMDAINACLGDYKDYSEEYDGYKWRNKGVEVKYYVNDGIWIDPYSGADEPVESSSASNSSSGSDSSKAAPIKDGKFNLSAFVGQDRLQNQLNSLKDSDYSIKLDDDPITETYEIYDKNSSLAGLLTFCDANGDAIKTYASSNGADAVDILVETKNTADMQRFILALIRCSDPSLTHDDASKVGAAVIDTGSCGKNGIIYKRVKDGNYYLLEASIGEAEDTSVNVNTQGGTSGTLVN